MRQRNSPLDTQPAGEGDSAWRGVWAQGDVDKIPTGHVAAAQNVTFLAGTARTRKGSYVPAGFRHADLSGPLFGSGVFSDPDGKEWMLVATEEHVWRLRDGHTPRRIALPAEIAARVEFVQAFNRVLLFRGAEKTPWSWDGTVAHAFEEVSQAETDDGTKPIPNGPDTVERPGLRPVLLNQRLYIPHDRVSIAASDVLEYTRYDASFADFNLAGPSDDATVALYPFNNSSLLVFNDQSIQILDGLSASLVNPRLQPISGSIGCVAAGTVQQVGADVFFLAATGVFRVTQVVESRLAAAAQAVSYPIEKIIARINFTAASAAVAAVHGRYYWLAVPLDGALRPNAVLRYDTIAEAWQGVDIYTEDAGAVTISALHKTDFQGERRLYALDYVTGTVRLLEYGRYDHAPSAGDGDPAEVEAIAARIETRGYLMRENQTKRFLDGRVMLRGWGPSYTIAAIGPGVNDTLALVPATAPDRTKYRIFGAADYVPSNANDDHAAADRQDYSVNFGTAWSPEDAGVDIDLEQFTEEAFTVRRTARHLQLVITNTAGTLECISAQLDADAGPDDLRPKGA